MFNYKKWVVVCKVGVIVLLSMVMLSGCNSNKSHEKTIIVGCETASMVSQKTEDEINRYIKEQGCDYTVKFIDLCEKIGKEFEDISTVEYAEYIERYVNEGNKLDICLAGRMLDGAWKGSYEMLIEDGYLYKLDDYLNSERGLELYDSIPESKWESNRYMDGIYGVNAYAYNCQTGVAYVVNNDIMEKYNLSIDDVNKPLDELCDILKNVQTGESSNGGFAVLNYVMSLTYTGMYPADGYIEGIYLDENNQDTPVAYLLENKGYIDILRSMYDMYNDIEIDVSQDTTVVLEKNFINIFVGGIFPGENLYRSGWYSSDKDFYENELSIIYPYGNNIRINDQVSCNAVMDASDNKEAALDFLTRMYADKYVVDLLSYGYGYRVTDGHAYIYDKLNNTLCATGVLSSWSYGNGFIGTASCDEFADKNEFYARIYANADVSPYLGFRFDRTGYENYVNNSNEVIYKLYKLFSNDTKDFDTYIYSLLQEYKSCGGEKLFEAIEEQYKQFVHNR